jgi:hypothetical protein
MSFMAEWTWAKEAAYYSGQRTQKAALAELPTCNLQIPKNCHSEARVIARGICCFAAASRFLADQTGFGMTRGGLF